MKKSGVILGVIIILISSTSCIQKPDIVANFKDMRVATILDYIETYPEQYSSFLSLLKVARLDGTLSAYNPRGLGYTLFLPDNNAIDEFIKKSKYSSLAAMLADSGYVYQFCRYHVVNLAIKTYDFPFGALPDLTLTKDYLTVSFVVQPDTSYYLINNQARITKQNIELSNGYIHVLANALTPITFTSYGWMMLNSGFSIFRAAVDVTGFKDTLDLNSKLLSENSRSFTLLLEPDSIYNKRGIYSLSDLEKLISPLSTDYTNKSNPLYNYVGYHVLSGTRFLDKLFGLATNYDTYSEVPLFINGQGIDIQINAGKQSFDTIINTPDTTIINWVGFYYDQSNIVTQSGAIHFINQILRPQTPSRAKQTFEFWEEPLFLKYRLVPASYLIEDPASLSVITWSGADLTYVKLPDIPNVSAIAWSNDYITLNGDFSVSYKIPALVQGVYTAFIQADAFNSTNAVIQIFIDGKQLGGSVDLTSGGTAAFPFVAFQLGTIQFQRYEQHTVEVRSLIPGRFLWDYVQFVPF